MPTDTTAPMHTNTSTPSVNLFPNTVLFVCFVLWDMTEIGKAGTVTRCITSRSKVSPNSCTVTNTVSAHLPSSHCLVLMHQNTQSDYKSIHVISAKLHKLPLFIKGEITICFNAMLTVYVTSGSSLQADCRKFKNISPLSATVTAEPVENLSWTCCNFSLIAEPVAISLRLLNLLQSLLDCWTCCNLSLTTEPVALSWTCCNLSSTTEPVAISPWLLNLLQSFLDCWTCCSFPWTCCNLSAAELVATSPQL